MEVFKVKLGTIFRFFNWGNEEKEIFKMIKF